MSEDGKKFTVQICEDENGVKIPFCVAMGRDIELKELAAILAVENIENAVVISDGNVLVDTGFSGIIIAKGAVSLKVSGSEQRVVQGATGLASLMEHEIIGPYFNGYKAEKKKDGDDADRLQMTELIRVEFEDWVKN